VTLRLLDGLGQVVVAGDQVDDVDDAIAPMSGEVKTQTHVDALLLSGVRQSTESQFHPGQHSDPLLRGVSLPAGSPTGVVPVDTQHGQPAVVLDLCDEGVDQASVVDVDPAAQGGTGDSRSRGSQQIADVDVEGAV
jgi:hypothetical protein